MPKSGSTVLPSSSQQNTTLPCGRFQLRCTKIRQQRSAEIQKPPFSTMAPSKKMKAPPTTTTTEDDSIRSYSDENSLSFPPPDPDPDPDEAAKEVSSSIDRALEAWAAASLARKKFYEKRCDRAKKFYEKRCDRTNDPYSMEACIEYLSGMEGVNPDQFVKACESFKQKNWRKVFINLPPHMKSHWVLNML